MIAYRLRSQKYITKDRFIYIEMEMVANVHPLMSPYYIMSSRNSTFLIKTYQFKHVKIYFQASYLNTGLLLVEGIHMS